MAAKFSWQSYLARLLLGIIIVFATYNPSGWSYTHWAILPLVENIQSFSVLKALAGLTLGIGWAVYIHATLRSLGVIGLILAAAFFTLLFWLLISQLGDWGKSADVIQYVVLLIVALVISTGVSWSHIHRRLTGQIDVDEMDEG